MFILKEKQKHNSLKENPFYHVVTCYKSTKIVIRLH